MQTWALSRGGGRESFKGVVATAGTMTAIHFPWGGLRVPMWAPSETPLPSALFPLPFFSSSPVTSHISRLPLYPVSARMHVPASSSSGTNLSRATSEEVWGGVA